MTTDMTQNNIPHSDKTYDVLIIGGGLSGLTLATLADQAGLDWQLIEARDRLGGRIVSAPLLGPNGGEGLAAKAVVNHQDHRLDLGPAWFWGGQPRIKAMIQQLGLKAFRQHAAGNLTFEDPHGSIRRDLDFDTTGGAFRVQGGMEAIIQGLAARLASDRIHLGTAASAIDHSEAGVVTVTTASTRIRAQHVAFALPPRVLARRFDFTPALPADAHKALLDVPTWMGGHAKIMAVYPTAFWRAKGLSGDGISHRGPMMQIHDASPEDAGYGALFGFVGIDALTRARMPRQDLIEMAKAQLVRLFGDDARAPLQITLMDWAQKAETATQDDYAPLAGHPRYGMPHQLEGLGGGRLHVTSTEMGATMGGYMEGAIEAAEATFAALTDHLQQAA